MEDITKIKQKIRALIEDWEKSDLETFYYTNSSSWILSEENINSIIKVTKNNTELGSGEYSFNTSTNEINISASLSSGDIIIVKYNYYSYSDNELDEYIRGALVWLSIFGHEEHDYELEDDTDIYPTPSNEVTDLIALISSILIKPDYTEYRLPNRTVRYNNKATKEEKIEKLIMRFYSGIGVIDILEFD